MDHLTGMCAFSATNKKNAITNRELQTFSMFQLYFFLSEPLFTTPPALSAFLFLIMLQFRYPVLLWPNKSGATPIIKRLCQENCVNQMLRAGNSCPKMNNVAVGGGGGDTCLVP